MFDGLLGTLEKVSTDALFAQVGKVIEAQVEPFYAKIRGELLARCTGSPPSTFRARLAEAGWPIDDAGAAILWRALISAASDIPADVGSSAHENGKATALNA